MLSNKARWISKQNGIGTASHDLVDLEHLTDSLLIARDVKLSEKEAFLNPDFGDLEAPEKILGLTPAVHRIKKAMAAGEKIVVYGDYDVDGMTSISILVRAFREIDYPVVYYIPDRHDEGYGLNAEAIKTLIADGAKVIITVDCGISSTVEADICRSNGVDLIITDHHEPHAVLPEAFAILNPKQPGCGYGYKHLAGAGIALRVAEALLEERFEAVKTELLELSAFGTVADVAPLLGENRIIVYHGLSTMSETVQVGLRALIEATEMTGKKITAGHIGFILAPKLNAAGRISDAMLGVRLLTTLDPIEAADIAKRLVEMNEQRQAIEREIVEAAIEQVELKRDPSNVEQPLPPFLVVSGEGWHGGVIGIVASRIVERYHRPVIVFGVENGIAKGSGRSIEGFNLFEALQGVGELFSKFGGHEQAAGMTLEAVKLPELEAKLNIYAGLRLTSEDFKPLYRVEATLAKEAIRFELTELLKELEPFGIGNPKPLFRVNNLMTEKVTTIGRVKTYLKVVASDGLRNFDLVNFRNSEIFEPLKSKMRFDALVTVEENEFRGVKSIQFDTRDIRIHEPLMFFETEDVQAFNQLKADTIIHKAYRFQKVPSKTQNEQMGSDPLDKQVSVGTDVAQGGHCFFAYSLQGWLSYCHRWLDEMAGRSTGVGELHLCPLTEPEGGICLDPPGYELKTEASGFVPNRDQLKRLYLAIRSGEGLESPLTLPTILSLRILESAGLIRKSGHARYQICEVTGKVDLTASPLFSALTAWAK